MATTHKLTDFAARSRWKKKHRGKVYYIGPAGVKKTDHAAYQKALAEWRQLEATLDADAQHQDDEQRLAEATRQQSGGLHPIIELQLAERSLAGEFSDDGEPGNPIHRITAARLMDEARRLGVADLLANRIQAVTLGGTTGDLAGLIGQFITTHQRRHQVGDLSAGRFDQLRRDANHFLA